MARFTFEELKAITGGRWLVAPGSRGGVVGVSTDSRTLEPGELFVALQGERLDGHDFVTQAAAAGAGAVIVSRPARIAGPTLLVPDTRQAYQRLARAHRQRFPRLQVVGITGSVGKTSTKEMLGAICRAAWDEAVLVTPGNANTQLGVPQTLLALGRNHRVAVVETGTSRPGELAILADVIRPDVAVLTTLAPAHLEGLGDLDGVAREKASLLAALGARGRAVIPAELVTHHRLTPHLPLEVLTVATAAPADVIIDYLGGDLGGSSFRVLRPDRPALEIRWSLTGRHLALNAGFAVAAAAQLGIPDEAITTGLNRVRLPGMRMEITETGGVTWINDAYNASPRSVAALIDWLTELPAPAGRLVLVLGDMAELGERAGALHREILALAADRLPGATLLVYGPLMAAAAPQAVERFTDEDDLRKALAGRLRPGDRVALKGSRALGLDRLVPSAGRRAAPAAGHDPRPA